MRSIIYGIGKKYREFFSNLAFVRKKFIEGKIEIVGFADGDDAIFGMEIKYFEKKFTVQNIDDFQSEDIDMIIVTSKLYFNEIREKLILKKYEKNQILLIDDIYESYVNEILHTELFRKKQGIEIGGPSKLFADIYGKCCKCDNVNFSKNTLWWTDLDGKFNYENKVLGENWIAEATKMDMIKDENYDFVLSSNNLEHIANPLKAIMEFLRIVKINGLILVAVPIKEKTFDHNRECTSFEHILKDYQDDIGEDDLSHLPDIIKKHDYSMDIECGGKEKFIRRAERNFENRCLHHHVFNEVCLRRIFEFVGLEVIDFNEIMGNWLIIGKK